MTQNHQPQDRREFIKRSAVFGAAAAGAAMGPWANPTFASMSPPAALGGSESLGFDGGNNVTIDPETGKGFLHLWLEGFGAQGSWDLHLQSPPTPAAGVHMTANMSPSIVDYTGGAYEVKNVFLTFCLEDLDPGAEGFELTYLLQAVPTDSDGSPVVVEKTIYVGLS